MATPYNHKAIEQKWRKHWQEHPVNVNDGKKPKYYCLDMFPYPSGSGLHVGHWRGYVISDVWSRYKLLNGYYVIHPMGWDAFGLPAENYAIKMGTHPRISTEANIKNIKRQINSGSLPFALTVDSYSTVSPSLGENSLSAMVLAGLIAFALIVVLMTALYRLPGFLACIALAGQVAATLAFVSGYFPVFESFTLTLPGIAGIILAIGMGVDANVITAERIKEELRSGKSLDGALKSGFARGLTPSLTAT